MVVELMVVWGMETLMMLIRYGKVHLSIKGNNLRCMDTLLVFSAIFTKGNNFVVHFKLEKLAPTRANSHT